MPRPRAHHIALAALQGGWVALRTPRLPEATGPRQGSAGTGPGLRLLIAGDSSAAGVGVASQDAALAGQLAHALAGDFSVEWRLIAHSGATTAAMLKRLEGEIQPCTGFDAAVLALGVNDVIRQVPLHRWLERQEALHRHLTGALGVRFVYASGVPPMGRFPALPATLAALLGTRAARFDAALAALSPRLQGHRHLPFSPELLDSKVMASDGFHPGATGYAHWAAALAHAIRADFGATP
ncbi:MAG: SGNH/GDSL hydrolase family protein [Pararhodobacter sp.]|nr:SGNH/GDSL hydrolase family protein [Pararhodobacter sp.]